MKDAAKAIVPDIVKWRRRVLYFNSLGLIDADMVVRCFLLAEGATTGSMALKGRGHRTHWTEDQIAKIWRLSPKQARVHLRRLQHLGLLGFWRGNKRLPAERWLLLPTHNQPPASWPWGAFESLSSPVVDRFKSAALSPVVGENESGSFGLPAEVESGEIEEADYRSFRSDVSVAVSIDTRPGVIATPGVVSPLVDIGSVASTPGVHLDDPETTERPATDGTNNEKRDGRRNPDTRTKKSGSQGQNRCRKQPGAVEDFARRAKLGLLAVEK